MIQHSFSTFLCTANRMHYDLEELAVFGAAGGGWSAEIRGEKGLWYRIVSFRK